MWQQTLIIKNVFEEILYFKNAKKYLKVALTLLRKCKFNKFHFLFIATLIVNENLLHFLKRKTSAVFFAMNTLLLLLLLLLMFFNFF